MKLGVRGKLFLASVSLITLVILISGAFLSQALREILLQRIETELLHHARSGKTLVESIAADPREIGLADRLIDSLGEATESRITLILEDGTVLGDSELTPREVAEVENHAGRPEVVDAFSSGTGKSSRFSTTIDEELLYVAVVFERNDSRGIVRAAKPLAEVESAIYGLFGLLAAAGLFGLILAVLMSALSSHYFSRTLRALVGYAHRMAEGGSREPPIPVSSEDELGGLAGSLHRLSGQLERQLTALARERDRFEAVLEGMSEAVLALDRDGRVTLINHAGLELLGFDQRPEGRTLLETVRAPEMHELVSGLKPGEAATAEFDLPGSRGEAKRVLARTVRRMSGEYTVVLLDVTDLRRLENVRREFVANVSHELRTPVSIIRANAETLLDGAMQDEKVGRRFLESVVNNAERLSGLISDLLDLSRIESGKYDFQIEGLDVESLLRRAKKSRQERAQRRGIAIEVEPANGLCALADARAVDQVLLNLVDNAVKYIDEGGRIVLRGLERGETVRFEVEDDGPGIEEVHCSRLFERFYRVDTGRSREMGGTGLGLAIVKHLVGAQGGEAGMRPAEARGSIFWFDLPRAPADPLKAADS
ncbi:MAG: ATP-binding protein [Polyangia bacterium]